MNLRSTLAICLLATSVTVHAQDKAKKPKYYNDPFTHPAPLDFNDHEGMFLYLTGRR